MADEIQESVVESEPVSDPTDPGVPDGHVDESGEKIVYEYDGDKNFVGWHKETA